MLKGSSWEASRRFGPLFMMLWGWSVVLVGLALWPFTDYRYALAGGIIGIGEFAAGLVWWAYREGSR